VNDYLFAVVSAVGHSFLKNGHLPSVRPASNLGKILQVLSFAYAVRKELIYIVLS